MTTAIDSNVLIAFWDADNTLNSLAQSALTAAWNRGNLVIAAPVYAELLAFPRRTEGGSRDSRTEKSQLAEPFKECRQPSLNCVERIDGHTRLRRLLCQPGANAQSLCF